MGRAFRFGALVAIAVVAACASYRSGSEKVALMDQIRIFPKSDDPAPPKGEEPKAAASASPNPTPGPSPSPSPMLAAYASGPADRTLTPTVSSLEADARRDYERAAGLLARGHEREALVSFEDFLRRWPTHALADDARMGVAETKFRQRSYAEAAREYEKVLSYTGPSADRAAEASVRLGECYVKMGESDKARIQLESVRRRYSGTVWAERAALLLGDLP